MIFQRVDPAAMLEIHYISKSRHKEPQEAIAGTHTREDGGSE